MTKKKVKVPKDIPAMFGTPAVPSKKTQKKTPEPTKKGIDQAIGEVVGGSIFGFFTWLTSAGRDELAMLRVRVRAADALAKAVDDNYNSTTPQMSAALAAYKLTAPGPTCSEAAAALTDPFPGSKKP